MKPFSSYFSTYSSASVMASGNQLAVPLPNEHKPYVSRAFYRLRVSGTHGFSLLFSNTLDVTHAFGEFGTPNRVVGEWSLHALRVAVVKTADPAVAESKFIPLTFDGKREKTVEPGGFFHTDPVTLTVEAGDELCVEMTFSGREVPAHRDALVPRFLQKEDGTWESTYDVPLPQMIGCDAPVRCRLAFFGDSITQGVGTEDFPYTNWAARIADRLPADVATWNLGIGFGRASDAQTNGAWMFRAKQNDVAVVCFGVNDLLKDFVEEGRAARIVHHVTKIVEELHSAGVRVLLQTAPPFDFENARVEDWKRVNLYLKTMLAPLCEGFFDEVPLLRKSEEEPQYAPFGGHPNSEGCARWADGLFPVVAALLEI